MSYSCFNLLTTDPIKMPPFLLLAGCSTTAFRFEAVTSGPYRDTGHAGFGAGVTYGRPTATYDAFTAVTQLFTLKRKKYTDVISHFLKVNLVNLYTLLHILIQIIS